MNGKGSKPRPLSVTPDTFAANYARIRWTDTEPCEPLQNATPFGIATPPDDVPVPTARDMPTESKVEN